MLFVEFLRYQFDAFSSYLLFVFQEAFSYAKYHRRNILQERLYVLLLQFLWQ